VGALVDFDLAALAALNPLRIVIGAVSLRLGGTHPSGALLSPNCESMSGRYTLLPQRLFVTGRNHFDRPGTGDSSPGVDIIASHEGDAVLAHRLL
jgi:hypothetical protein